MARAPHVDRALGLLGDRAAPLTQVWGWPGSGRADLLAALLEREDAWALSAADLAAPGRREQAVGAAVAGGARWLVIPGLPASAEPAEVVGAVAELLPADRRLVFAARRRLALPGRLSALVTPRELALRPEEVAALLEACGIPGVTPAAAAAVAAATDGWYRPVLLAARAEKEGGAGPAGAGRGLPEEPEGFVDLPAVADFLRFEVLADLPEEERAALAEGGSKRARQAVVRRLVEEWGLLLETPEGLRPPRLLAALLERERRREPSPPPVRPASPKARLPGEPPASARFRLHLLGRPEAWRRAPDGSWRRLRWPIRKALEALAFLASSPERRAARQDLAEALWAEARPATIEKNFHPTLSHLRRGLVEGAAGGGAGERPLLRTDGVYALDPELGWWIDVEDLERLAAAGRELAEDGRDCEAVAAWEAAWRLYRGAFLEGSSEPWAAARREVHQRRYLVLLQELGAAYERLGRPAEALDAYRALLAEDPLQERIHQAVLRIYGAQGRRDLVRRQYERLSELLRDELGEEPLEETSAEYHRLMTER